AVAAAHDHRRDRAAAAAQGDADRAAIPAPRLGERRAMNAALVITTFRRHRLPSLIAIPGVIMLLALGCWHVRPHLQRRAENALRAERLAEPPIAVDAALADPEGNRFRRVTATGRFDHGHEIHVYARSLHGNEGYFILTPLLREHLP